MILDPTFEVEFRIDSNLSQMTDDGRPTVQRSCVFSMKGMILSQSLPDLRNLAGSD